MKQFFALMFALFVAGTAFASSNVEHPKQMVWSFDGVFGKRDDNSVQRGLQVYKEVCSAAHCRKLTTSCAI